VSGSTGKPGFAERVLSALADLIQRRPSWFVIPQIALFFLSIGFTVARLQFFTSRNDLVGTDKLYHHFFLEYRREFPIQDDLVVAVESSDFEKNRQFVERLGARLEAETNLFAHPFYKGDFTMLGDKALMFLEDDELAALHDQLRQFKPFVDKFTGVTNFISLFQRINTEFRLAEKKSAKEQEKLLGSLPALQRIVDQANAALHRSGPPPSPGITALFGGVEAQNKLYITFDEGRVYLATVQPASAAVEREAVHRLHELVEDVRAEVPGVSVGVTGESILELAEMEQSQKDTMKASLIALVLVGLIFIYGYQESGRPIKATLCLLFGLAYTMGYTTLVIGHLNILTITFAPMLIGLAIDFGVHLVTRYEEEIRNGRAEWDAVRVALVNTGQGIFTGALTTAAAFFAMAITEFKGIQEMGLIAGGGLLLSLAPMMTLLPILLTRGRQNVIDRSQGEPRPDRLGAIEAKLLKFPGTVTVVTLILSALAAGQMFGDRVRFDYNLLHMQSASLPAVIAEERLIESAGNSVLYAAVMADSLEQARELQARIEKLPAVAEVRSMAEFIGVDPGPRRERIQSIAQLAASVRFKPIDTAPPRPKEVSQVLYSFQGYVGAASRAVREAEGESELYFQLRDLWDSVAAFRKSLNAVKPERAAAQLAEFQRAFLQDLRDTFAALARQRYDGPITAEDLPPALRDRFIGVTGKHLLQVFPKDDVWNKENQQVFVGQIRSVFPEVTGTPVQMLEYTSLLKDSYVEAALYALGATALMVLVHFRSFICMILSLLPVLMGAVWSAGIMGLTGLAFNPANIMTLPLVAGIGVTSGIHILNRFKEEQSPTLLSKSTGKAVLVSGLTTIAGFGSLCVADHRGIESLGYLMSIGTLACMVAALTFLPALIGLLMKAGWAKKTQRRECTLRRWAVRNRGQLKPQSTDDRP